MGKMKKGEGERIFDLKSKHMIFAYQVLWQSKKKMWSKITDANSLS